MKMNITSCACIKYLCLLAVFLLSGCATMQSSKEELHGMSKDEGIIIGSVLLTVQQAESQESGWAWLKGRKAAEQDYEVAVRESGFGFNPFATTYRIQIKAGEENIFVRKFPVGSYRFSTITKLGLGPMEARIGVGFTVTPGQTTYIGKLVINMPDRIGTGARLTYSIQDEQETAIKQITGEYAQVISTVTKNLMAVDR